jgi:hypothetical protein
MPWVPNPDPALPPLSYTADTEEIVAKRSDGKVHQGIRTFNCHLCGFGYRENELVIRNGLRVCKVAGTKARPCFDEPGFDEVVSVEPFDAGPKPDTEGQEDYH